MCAIILWNCSGSESQEDTFSMNFYEKNSKPNVSEPLIVLTNNDIDYVDWENMSFKLKDSVVEHKILNTKFKGGISKEYCMILFNKDSLFVNINNIGVSSNDHFAFDKPFMYTFKPTRYVSIGSSIFSKDNWIVIYPFYWNDSLKPIDIFKNEKLFIYFKNNVKLLGKSLEKDSNAAVKNLPNANFMQDFEKKFQSELP